MDSIEAPGQWWLPENPDHKVSGTLVIRESGEAELRLIGTLRSPFYGGDVATAIDGTTTITHSSRSMHNAGLYPRILGQAGSKEYTLDDCFQTQLRENLFGDALGLESIHVHQVLQGAWFEQGEGLEFTRLVLHMDWLAYWVELSGISENRIVDSMERTLTLRSIESQQFEGLDGTRMMLGQSWEVSGDGITERRLTQDFYFEVEAPTLMPLNALLSQAGALQDLVSIATGKRAAFKSISLRHPDVATRRGDTRYLSAIDLFAQWQVKNASTPKRLTSYDMPFSLTQLGGVDGISRWLNAVAEHIPALSRVMTAQYGSTYVGDLFLNCAAALEGYDRDRHGDDIYYLERLKRCVVHAGDLFAYLVDDTDAWARAVKNRRNDLAHHNAGVEAATTEQRLLGSSAYWLFVLCLLRDASAPDAVFDNIRQVGSFQWLKLQLTDLALA